MGKKDGDYVCSAEWCNKRFVTQFHQVNHSRLCEKKIFQCSKCHQRYTKEKTKDDHEKKAHINYTCPLCNKKIISNKGVESHDKKCKKNPANADRLAAEKKQKKKKPVTEGDFVCSKNLCGKKLKTDRDLKDHERRCTNCI